jgi:hypothetical protein
MHKKNLIGYYCLFKEKIFNNNKLINILMYNFKYIIIVGILSKILDKL